MTYSEVRTSESSQRFIRSHPKHILSGAEKLLVALKCFVYKQPLSDRTPNANNLELNV